MRLFPDCFSDKPVTHPNKVHLEVDSSVNTLPGWSQHERNAKRWNKMVLL